ncbi:ABC transporter permease [Nicoliella lavandulae]|uniref:ABC transporter permease n=1 Tax=Nicoliella lavandulae TaxID=3082954 RepID=A0ABU8SKR0_9LACO
MIDLFKTRLGQHLTEMVKYLRYVFNDFFVIALLFLIGGLGLSYSNLLKQLHTGLWWPAWIVLIVLLGAQSFNHLATLLKPADRVFLLPREVEMKQYLNHAFNYSFMVAALSQAAVWFVLIPFIRTTLAWNWTQLLLLLVTMVLLRGVDFQLVINQAYPVKHVRAGWHFTLYRWIATVVILGAFMMQLAWFGFGLGLLNLVVILWVNAKIDNRSLKWDFLIEAEDARMLSLYKFFNLFTDVPDVKRATKRRRYLDWLVNRIQATPQNIYLYLYGHSIVRNGEYSGLHLRLTLIGAVLLFGVSGLYLPILISLLFIYLIGFQLIPFYSNFAGNVFTHIYPVSDELQISSFKKIISILLLVTAVIFAVMAFIGSHSLLTGGITLGFNLIEVWFLVNRMIPKRIQNNLN